MLKEAGSRQREAGLTEPERLKSFGFCLLPCQPRNTVLLSRSEYSLYGALASSLYLSLSA